MTRAIMPLPHLTIPPAYLRHSGIKQTRKFDGACSVCGQPVKLVLYNGQALWCTSCGRFTAHRRERK